MGIARTFKGGVHPHEVGNGKEATNQKAIFVMKAPARVTIPLSQHIGAPCKCAVEVGQQVTMGQVIGEAGGFVSAPVHASVSGKVVAITTCTLATGRNVEAVVIENDGLDTWAEGIAPRENVDALTKEELSEIVRKAGIVGMGGATFPTAVKLNPPAEKKVDTLIINGAECEPYLTDDHLLLREHSDQLIRGALVAKKILGASKAYVGIEDNKPDAIASMTAAAQGKGVEVVALKTKYPQGGEKQLIYAVTRRRVPNGGLPADVGVVVVNVSTTAAIETAVYKGQPLISRVMTVTGKIKNPMNVRVRIGTMLSDVVEACGGLEEGVRKLILGGPMMGPATTSLNIPVMKGTGGLLAMGDEGVHAKESPCIRCGRCIEACPMGLVPTQIDALVRRSRWSEAEKAGTMNCLECGACTFGCPAKRELTQSCRMAKVTIVANRKKS